MLNKRNILPVPFSKPIVIIFFISLLYSLYVQVNLGMDGFWDTMNYHYYIGWAFSEYRTFQFDSIASYHSYLNPLLDFINYSLFSFHPYLGALFHSLIYAVSSCVLCLLALRCFPVDTFKRKEVYYLCFMSLCIGMTGTMGVSLFGSFTNEHQVSLLVLIALLLSVNYIQAPSPFHFCLIAIFLGGGLGFKLTIAPYLIACTLALFLITGVSIIRLFYFALSGLLGFLIVDGYFLFQRLWETGNPVFPMANNVFNSKFYQSTWFSFGSVTNLSIQDYLTLPVQWLYSGLFSEAGTSRDPRLLLGFIGCFIVLIAGIKGRATKQEMFLVLFFCISWLSWILLFRVWRYLIVLEYLSGILILLGVWKLKYMKLLHKMIIVFLIMILLIECTRYANWGRRAWQDNFQTSDFSYLRDIGKDKSLLVLLNGFRVSIFSEELKRMNIDFASLQAQSWYDGLRHKSPIAFSVKDLDDFEMIFFLQQGDDDISLESKYLEEYFDGYAYKCQSLDTNAPAVPSLCKFVPI